MSIGVIGSGAFGTALAAALAADAPVQLWSRSPEQVRDIQKTGRNNARLPGIDLPKTVSVTADFDQVAAASTLLLAVPMQQLRGLLTGHRDILAGHTLVACCKGMELGTGLGPVSVIEQVLPSARAALLTGPSFAQDIARGLPTALTLACADPDVALDLQRQLNTSTLRVYRTTDTTGAELGGALKNVIAIGCGAVIGAALGDSARAALMTRGYSEMQRMALRLGARSETLAGLSGFGDLALTCTSGQSRNYQLGLALAQGTEIDRSVTVEGAVTARAVAQRARLMDLDMPITDMVVALLDRTASVTDAMESLFSRPLKEE